ncbi:cytochrome c oxidase subunit 3, partial [Escherichia coli]|nr:cytochrome c oxidase subunit 3 [Escherichia coli]
LLQTPDPKLFPPPSAVIGPWKLPLITPILLVTSSFTVTFARHALKKNKRGPLKAWLALTVLLGIAFLILQAEEYVHAYNELGLT